MTSADMEGAIIMTNQKLETLEGNIEELKMSVKALPDEITKRVNEVTELKIRLACADLESKFAKNEAALYRWVIGLGLTSIVSMGAAIIGLIK